MNKLIVLSAVPGSGKSYFTILLKEKKKDGHVYVVSSDSIRAIIGGNQQNFTNESLTWQMYYDLAKVYAKDPNGIVVLDSTNAQKKFRIDAIKSIYDLFDEVDLVMFKIDKVTVMKQNLERDYPIPIEALERLINEFQPVTKEDEEFFDNIYIIDQHDFGPTVDKVLGK